MYYASQTPILLLLKIFTFWIMSSVMCVGAAMKGNFTQFKIPASSSCFCRAFSCFCDYEEQPNHRQQRNETLIFEVPLMSLCSCCFDAGNQTDFVYSYSTGIFILLILFHAFCCVNFSYKSVKVGQKVKVTWTFPLYVYNLFSSNNFSHSQT